MGGAKTHSLSYQKYAFKWKTLLWSLLNLSTCYHSAYFYTNLQEIGWWKRLGLVSFLGQLWFDESRTCRISQKEFLSSPVPHKFWYFLSLHIMYDLMAQDREQQLSESVSIIQICVKVDRCKNSSPWFWIYKSWPGGLLPLFPKLHRGPTYPVTSSFLHYQLMGAVPPQASGVGNR